MKKFIEVELLKSREKREWFSVYAIFLRESEKYVQKNFR